MVARNTRAAGNSVGDFKDVALSTTRDFVRHLWARDFDWCRNRTADDFVFIGPDHDYMSSDQNEFSDIIELLSQRIIRSSITDERYKVLIGDESICCVFGQFLVLTPPDEERIRAQWRRCTFVWRRSGKAISVVHAHISAPTDYVEEGESYPIHVGTETYRYMKSLMRLGSSRKSVSLYDVNGTVHWVHPSQIIYLEANRKRTIVHCMTKDIVVPAVIRDAVEMVDNKILRVHRSFAVNRDHVVELKGGILLLDDGTSIAIPAKRIADVRAELK